MTVTVTVEGLDRSCTMDAGKRGEDGKRTSMQREDEVYISQCDGARRLTRLDTLYQNRKFVYPESTECLFEKSVF